MIEILLGLWSMTEPCWRALCLRPAPSSFVVDIESQRFFYKGKPSQRLIPRQTLAEDIHFVLSQKPKLLAYQRRASSHTTDFSHCNNEYLALIEHVEVVLKEYDKEGDEAFLESQMRTICDLEAHYNIYGLERHVRQLEDR